MSSYVRRGGNRTPTLIAEPTHTHPTHHKHNPPGTTTHRKHTPTLPCSRVNECPSEHVQEGIHSPSGKSQKGIHSPSNMGVFLGCCVSGWILWAVCSICWVCVCGLRVCLCGLRLFVGCDLIIFLCATHLSAGIYGGGVGVRVRAD
jgi:hypothetical protein